MSEPTPTSKKLDELYDLIKGIEIALMTTRRPDGSLVTRPMATQERGPLADLWFVTDVEAHKVEDIRHDPNVNLGYYDNSSREWVSVSGTATVSQDRRKIRELHQPDWRAWFNDEGGGRDGGPDDPRLALILVEAHAVHYMKTKYSKPRVLFEIARGILTGTDPDVGREEHLSAAELHPAGSSPPGHKPTKGLYGWVTHTELASDDPAATKAWCAKVLGWTFKPSFPTPGGDYHLFAYSDQGGGGIRANNPPEQPGTIPYVHVADAHAAYKKALAEGAREMLAPTRVMEGVTIAVVRAPGGVPIGLSGP